MKSVPQPEWLLPSAEPSPVRWGGWLRALSVALLGVFLAAALTGCGTATPDAPVASAGGPYTGYAGSATLFSAASSRDPLNEVLSYSWNFGDGGTGSGVNPTHVYANAGTFAVSVTVTDASQHSGTATTSATIAAAPINSTAKNGEVHGGQQPVAGATVQIWQVGTTGYGLGAAPLGSSVLTDANGYFVLTGAYNCANAANGANTLVYVTAMGGNPGMSSGSNNPALAMMTALGRCGNLTPSTYISINEVTTVASVFALAQFMSPSGGVGSYAGSTTGLANAFATVNNLVNTATGAALSQTPGGNGIAPLAKVNTLADILAICVNSAGASSPGCSQLFSTVAPISGAAPTTTIGAALAIALSPGTNATQLLNLNAPSAPFAPTVSSVNDWTLTLAYATGGTAPAGVALDSSGNVWVPNYGTGGATSSVSLLNAVGIPASNSPYTASGSVNGATALALDPSGNAWVANHDNNSALELNAITSGSTVSVATVGGPFTAGNLNAPQAVAVDAQADIWFVNAGNNSLTELPQGSYSTGTAVTGIGLSTPKAIAFDNQGDLWVTNSVGGSVAELNPTVTPSLTATFPATGLSSPSSVSIDASSNVWVTDASTSGAAELNHGGLVLSPTSGFTGGGLAAANASAIDGSGNFWVADAQSGYVSVRNAAGAAVTPANGYQDASLSHPSGLAIDASGNVWISNQSPVTQSGKILTVSQMVGAAAPAIMPLSAAVQQHAVGQKPGAPQAILAIAGGPYAGIVAVPVTFTAAGSLDPANETLTYGWSFGDGAIGSGLTPSHAYNAAGRYVVTLTVTNTDGRTATITTCVTVVAASATVPTVSAGGPYTGTTAAAVSFDGTGSYDPASQGSGATALTLVWNFGDGANGYGATPVHTYAAAGTYTVTLAATTASGGTSSATTTATITQGTVVAGTPAANANGPYTGTVGTAVQFNNAGSSDPNSLPLTYRWDFGDGASVFGSNPTHTYISAGTFSVTLSVNNGSTAPSATVSTIATIAPAPATALVASAGGPYSVAVNQVLQLNGSGTTNPNNGQLVYTWDFGDGSTGTGAQPYHVWTSQGTFRVNLNVTDAIGPAGNATTQVTVGAPPAEAITASTGGPYTNTPNQTITFDASASRDNLSYPLTYSWTFGDGATGTGLNPTHAYTAAGTYTVTVTATSGTATGSSSSSVTITPTLGVVITSPASGALLAVSTTTVTGTVSTANATVTVNGVTAQVSGTNFTAAGVSLREGVNLITAAATAGGGAAGNGTVSVVVDLTPPGVAITSPANNSSVSQSTITVAGLVNDIVTGTVGSNQVTVTVNGLSSPVSNRSFALAGVQLTPGANTITAVATDRVGNVTRTSATVNYVPATQQLSLHILSGDAQTGAVRSVLPQPLVVQLLTGNGTPVPGRPITFTVSRSDGMVEVMPTVAQSLSVTTDASGKASALFMLGARQGLAINQVTASTPGAGGTVTWMESTTAATPTQIHVVRGENQRGLLGEPLAEAFQVIVTDDYANPIPGTTVTFTPNIDGSLDNTSVVTDANGKAAATLTLGQQEGISNYTVSADFSGDTGTAPVFMASAFAPGPVANTVVSGAVLDNSNTPVPNATVKLQGTTLSTVTDSNGVFSIPSAPVGTVTLTVDGSTSTSTHTFPFLSFVLEDLPGVNNTLNKPIYLPFIDVNNAQTVGGNDPVTLTMKGVPGVAFTVAPNSVTFPDGSNVGQLSLSQVKSDMVPMIPNNSSSPDLVWTLQPAGTKFNPPIQITMPNTQALPPGTVSEFYQFDHDLEQFVSAGTGHVSADGSVVLSDAGFGISKAGWGHGPTLPLPPHCPASCDDHNECTADTVVPPGPGGGCPSCMHTPIGGSCGVQPNHNPGNTARASVNACRGPGTCSNGACIAPFLPDGTSCDNGVFCEMPEACKSGVCTGKEIPSFSAAAIPGGLLKFEQTFESGIGPLYLLVNSKLGLGITTEPKFEPFGNLTTSCCEAKKIQQSQAYTAGITVGVKFSTGKIPLPPPFEAFYIPGLGNLGLYVAGDLTIAGTVQYDSDECTGKACFSGGPSVNLTIEGGVLASALGGNANVGISGGAGVAIKVGCDKATFDVGLNAINLVAGYTNPFTGKPGSIELPLFSATDLGQQSYALQ